MSSTSFRDSTGSFTNTSREDAMLFHHGEHTMQVEGRGGRAMPQASTPRLIPNVTEDPLALAPMANDMRDRAKLMRHITYLSSIVQRQQLEMQDHANQRSSDPTVAHHLSVELQRRFDPLVAESQMQRLDDLLAQQSMLREAEERRNQSLEYELERVRHDRDALVHRVREAEGELHAAKQWEAVATERQVQLQDATDEVDRLRRTEHQLVGRLRKMRVHLGLGAMGQEDDFSSVVPSCSTSTQTWTPSGGRHDAVQGEGASEGTGGPMESYRLERLFFEMDETAARQDLLVDHMFFEPLRVSLHTTVAYDTELQQLNAMQPSHADVGGTNMLHTGTRGATEGSTSHNTSTASASQQQQSLVLQSDLEVLRQQHLFLQMQFQRMERIVEGERTRNEQLAQEHQQQLEDIHEHLMQERKEYLERLSAEVQRGFREGMLRERANRKARRHGRTGHTADGPRPSRGGLDADTITPHSTDASSSPSASLPRIEDQQAEGH